MADEIKIKELLKECVVEILSENSEIAVNASKRIIDIISGKDPSLGLDQVEGNWDDINKYFEQEKLVQLFMKEILDEDIYLAVNVMQKLLPIYLRNERKKMASLNGKGSGEDCSMTTIKHMNTIESILLASSTAADMVKEQLFEILTGKDYGGFISSTKHKSLACALIAKLSSITTDEFNKILDYIIKEQDGIAFKSALEVISQFPENLEYLDQRLEKCSNEEDLEDLIKLYTVLAQNGVLDKSLYREKVANYLTHKDVYVVNAVIEGFLYNELIDTKIEQLVRDRREIEVKNSLEYDDDFDEDELEEDLFEFEGSFKGLSKERLLSQLSHKDAYQRAIASEGLHQFVEDNAVVEALADMLDDNEVIHDFNPPSYYALQALKDVRPLPERAFNLFKIQLENELNEAKQVELKNTDAILTGVEYSQDMDESTELILQVLGNNKPQAQVFVPLLKDTERFYTLRDVFGENRHIEKIREVLEILDS